MLISIQGELPQSERDVLKKRWPGTKLLSNKKKTKKSTCKPKVLNALGCPSTKPERFVVICALILGYY
jgi:hypothetical protein